MTEADIDAAVGRWLSGRGYDVHYQVEFQSWRIDVVGRKATSLVAVESKTRPSLALLHQALRSRPYAHEVWMAVETYTTSPIREIAIELGLGLLIAEDGEVRHGYGAKAHARIPSKLGLSAACVPEQKETAPGAGKGWSTAWGRWAKRFVEGVRVAGSKGVGLGDVLEASKPHWGRTASGRRRLLQDKLSSPQRRRHSPEFAGVVIEGRGKAAIVRWLPEEVF